MATQEITISELELADEILGDMNIPVDTATETRAVTLKQLRAWLGSSLPTGFIIPAVGKISDERFTLLDGKTLSREGTYSAFCNKVVSEVQAGNWFACSEEEYAQDISSFGQCGKFVVSNDYVRIPTITRFIGATITLSEIGKTYKESLPNIKGETTEQYSSLSDTSKGVFYKISQVQAYSLSGSGGTNWQKYGFDASRSSSTYQDNAKVQPDHTKYPYYMVISTEGQTAEVGIDINKVYEDLNLKVDKNSDYIDGQWVANYKVLSTATGVNEYTLDLSDYLPNDGYMYEVMVSTYLSRTDDSGTNTYLPIYNTSLGVDGTDGGEGKTNSFMNDAVDGANMQQSGGGCVVIVGADRTLNYGIRQHKLTAFALNAVAYRRIGTNG